MDNELSNLHEWSVLEELLDKIPTRIKKGLFWCDLNFTCIKLCEEFIAVGTNVGIIFWFNRKNQDLQKLRCESGASLKCISIVSSVEYMIAAGSEIGQVIIFQVQKEHPPDLNLDPLTKPKPNNRYTVKNLHHSPVCCVEWSKNGMKLFSGDKKGIVVLTEFDYQLHTSKSYEILNETYSIVQMSFHQSHLLISTLYRAIICQRESVNSCKWKIVQIGKKDRKILCEFGATFKEHSRNPTVICCRPGYRFWQADIHGNVLQTLLFKDAFTNPAHEVHLLNPGRYKNKLPQNFERVAMYRDKFLVVWGDNTVQILNLNNLTVEANVNHLRGILDLSINDKEIFILEGSRSLIRIADTPNIKSNITIFKNAEYTESLVEEPTQVEVGEAIIGNAEECFELPPIEHIDLSIAIELKKQHNGGSNQDSMILDHNRKIETYDRINSIDYDDSILFKSSVHNRKHAQGGQKKGNHVRSKKRDSPHKGKGIVEIGRLVVPDEDKIIGSTEGSTLENSTLGVITRPTVMDISICTQKDLLPDPRSPDSINRDIEIKEKLIAATLNIEPIIFEKMDTPMKSPKDMIPVLEFPLTTEFMNELKSTPIKKRENNIETESPTSDDEKLNEFSNLSDDDKKIMKKSEVCPDLHHIVGEFNVPSTSASYHLQPSIISPPIPKIIEMPKYMNIPSLWNITIEKADVVASPVGDEHNAAKVEPGLSGGRKSSDPTSDSSEWEIVEEP